MKKLLGRLGVYALAGALTAALIFATSGDAAPVIQNFNARTATAGVSTVNGVSGAVTLGVVTPADTVNTSGTELSAISAAALPAGSKAWVASVGDFFGLRVSTLTVDHLTVETAAGKTGYQWVREGVTNGTWCGQTTWYADPQNGSASDEATCADSGHPCNTLTEISRRLVNCTLASGSMTTVNLISDCHNTDKPVWRYAVQPGAVTPGSDGITILGTPATPTYTGTVTGFTQQVQGNNATATDNELVDTNIPTSFTASGLMATGMIFKRTNSTAVWGFVLKDLGSKTGRMTDFFAAPTSGVNGAITALAVNDTYTVSKLPKVYDQRVINGEQVKQAFGKFILQFVDDNATNTSTTGALNLSTITYDRSTVTTAHLWSSVLLSNTMLYGAGNTFGPGGNSFWRGGGAVTSGSFISVQGNASLSGSINGPLHFETTQLGFTTGAYGSLGIIACYDNTGDCLQVTQNATAGLNCIKGLGMGAASLIAHVICPSRVIYAGNTFTTDASSSNASPIKVCGSTFASASLPVTSTLSTFGGGIISQQ